MVGKSAGWGEGGSLLLFTRAWVESQLGRSEFHLERSANSHEHGPTIGKQLPLCQNKNVRGEALRILLRWFVDGSQSRYGGYPNEILTHTQTPPSETSIQLLRTHNWCSSWFPVLKGWPKKMGDMTPF